MNGTQRHFMVPPLQQFHTADFYHTLMDHHYLFIPGMMMLFPSFHHQENRKKVHHLFLHHILWLGFFALCLHSMLIQILFKIQELQLVYLLLVYRYKVRSAITVTDSINIILFSLFPCISIIWKWDLNDNLFLEIPPPPLQ